MQPQAKLLSGRDFFTGLSRLKPAFGRQYWGERAFDLIGAVVGMAVFALPMIVIALAIRLAGPGPVIFSQIRFGRDSQSFAVYKFRTMCHGRSHEGSRPCVSKIGRLLRRTSLDELPQLYNVLRGEMSLVGPRPHMVDMRIEGALYEHLIDNYHIRHTVRPGITGWAQINGCRGRVGSFKQAQDRVDLDLNYIRQKSIWLDIVILVLTLKNEFLLGNGS